jgi:hypothetical protein
MAFSLKSAIEKGLSKAELMLFRQLDQGTVLRKAAFEGNPGSLLTDESGDKAHLKARALRSGGRL